MAEDTTVPVLPDEDNTPVVEDDGKNLLIDETEVTEAEETKESTEETPEEAKDKTEDHTEEKPEETEESDESEAEESKEDEQSESEETEELDPKEKARREYQERQQSKKQLEQVLDSQWRTQTPDELVEAGLDPAEAKVLALEQRVELAEWRNQVVELNSTINQESLEVFKDYPVFDESSPDFDPNFAKEVGELYKQTADLEFDETGQYVVNAKVTPYDFYSRMAKLRGASVTKGKVEGQRATEKNLAAAEPTSTNKTTEIAEEEDGFLKGFDKVQ